MGKTHRKKRRLTQRQRQKRIRKYRKIGILVLATIFAVLVCVKYISPLLAHDEYTENNSETIDALRPDIDVQLLTVNPYSRPGTETNKIIYICLRMEGGWQMAAYIFKGRLQDKRMSRSAG